MAMHQYDFDAIKSSADVDSAMGVGIKDDPSTLTLDFRKYRVYWT
jgi:hypothetical protein